MNEGLIKTFYCPACGKKKTSLQVEIKDFEVKSWDNEQIISEGYVYQCETTNQMIVVIMVVTED